MMEIKEVQNAVIAKYGKEHQTFVAIEEMSELMKALTKNMRGEHNRQDIVEELADVYIVLDQIMVMHGIDLDDVVKEMNFKAKRLADRLEGDTDESV
jgi:NTP pyrophosphatase (non-canonical NTP hydrolase)